MRCRHVMTHAARFAGWQRRQRSTMKSIVKIRTREVRGQEEVLLLNIFSLLSIDLNLFNVIRP